MAFLPLCLLFLFVSSTFAGEIGTDTGDNNTDDFQVQTEDQVEKVEEKTAENKTKDDRSGLEPNFPVNPDFSNTFDSTGAGVGAFQCPSIRYRNKCYFLALSQESWYTSRDYCRRIGQTLARIDSSDEATFLASYLYEGGRNNYWVDLNDEHTEGIWTNANGAPAFTDWWAPNEPNGNRGENCGLLVIGEDRIGRLVDDPCREWRRYICERRTESVCRRAGYKSKCFWFSVQPATWFNAREYCATMGQRLARVTATDELNFLARVMPRASWIDLRHGGQGVGWTYADGSSSAGIASFFGGEGFMGGFAGPRCAELRRYNQKEGRSVGTDCNAIKHFICESESLPPGSEIVNPEDLPGSVIGSQFGGQAVGPAGPINPFGTQMMGGMAGLGPGMGGPAVMGPMGPMGPIGGGIF